jgi:glycosyltransferase involved in cell wall biosynthesis
MTRPLKLAYVGPAASVTFRRWVEWFAARKHEVTVLTVEPAPSPMFRQIDLRESRGPRRLGRVMSALRLGKELNRLCPDLVHVHYVRGLAWGAVRQVRCPVVATPWGSDVLEEQGAFKEWYSRPLTRGVLNRADLVTVHSAYMEERVRPLLESGRRVVRIGWGVDLTKFREGVGVGVLRRQWELRGDQPVLFSPRLGQRLYRHEGVIRAMPAILKKVPHAVLAIAEQFPDASYLAELRTLVGDLKLGPHVRFIGSVPYERMPAWFNLADAVVMMPESDGMPNSLLETMACGSVPVLAPLPQYREAVEHGVNGFLVEPDPSAISHAVIRAMSEPVLRREMAERNRTFAETCADQDKEMARMEGWYSRLIGGAAARTEPCAA